MRARMPLDVRLRALERRHLTLAPPARRLVETASIQRVSRSDSRGLCSTNRATLMQDGRPGRRQVRQFGRPPAGTQRAVVACRKSLGSAGVVRPCKPPCRRCRASFDRIRLVAFCHSNRRRLSHRKRHVRNRSIDRVWRELRVVWWSGVESSKQRPSLVDGDFPHKHRRPWLHSSRQWNSTGTFVRLGARQQGPRPMTSGHCFHISSSSSKRSSGAGSVHAAGTTVSKARALV